MFIMTMPDTFKVGDTADVRINGETKQLTWRDTRTLVIEPNDHRAIHLIESSVDTELRTFFCTDAAQCMRRSSDAEANLGHVRSRVRGGNA